MNNDSWIQDYINEPASQVENCGTCKYLVLNPWYNSDGCEIHNDTNLYWYREVGCTRYERRED